MDHPKEFDKAYELVKAQMEEPAIRKWLAIRKRAGALSELVEAAKQEARWPLDRATAVQRARFWLSMQDIEPHRGSPRHARADKAVRRIWNETTLAAPELLVAMYHEHMEHREISEATSARWDELMAQKTHTEVA